MTAYDPMIGYEARPTEEDRALDCFIAWCRLNPANIVRNPIVSRRVHDAYMNLGEPS